MLIVPSPAEAPAIAGAIVALLALAKTIVAVPVPAAVTLSKVTVVPLNALSKVAVEDEEEPAPLPVIFTVVALTPPAPVNNAAPADVPDVVVPIVKVSAATVPENVITAGATLVVRLLIT